MKKNSATSLVLWYIPALAVQLISTKITMDELAPWYSCLVKAPWTPPPFVFGPVWTLLYILMTLSVWTIYRSNATTPQQKKAYSLYFTQLALNAAWTLLFFRLREVGLALVDLALLTGVLIYTNIYFFKLKRAAGWLLIPYTLWVGYALTLNVAIWILNR